MCPSWSRWQSSKHTLGWRITVDFKESAAQTVLKNRPLFVIVVARLAKVLSGMVAHGCRYLIFSFYTTTEAGSFPERCTFKRAVFRDRKCRFCGNGKAKYIRGYTGKRVNEWNLEKRSGCSMNLDIFTTAKDAWKHSKMLFYSFVLQSLENEIQIQTPTGFSF